jgi:hypothetical protein
VSKKVKHESVWQPLYSPATTRELLPISWKSTRDRDPPRLLSGYAPQDAQRRQPSA